jgi:hypothetical protein
MPETPAIWKAHLASVRRDGTGRRCTRSRPVDDREPGVRIPRHRRLLLDTGADRGDEVASGSSRCLEVSRGNAKVAVVAALLHLYMALNFPRVPRAASRYTTRRVPLPARFECGPRRTLMSFVLRRTHHTVGRSGGCPRCGARSSVGSSIFTRRRCRLVACYSSSDCFAAAIVATPYTRWGQRRHRHGDRHLLRPGQTTPPPFILLTQPAKGCCRI